ncbi:MAG: hypothetical protein WC653_05815, partial [Candidatus Gracilibacteria bacterium]
MDRVSYEDWDTGTPVRDITYAYDASTRGLMKPARITSNFGDFVVVYNSYDTLGNLTQETRSIKKPSLTTFYNYIFQTTYDLLSRPTKVITSPTLTVNYTYNAAGALESVTRGVSTLTDVISNFDYS